MSKPPYFWREIFFQVLTVLICGGVIVIALFVGAVLGLWGGA